MAWDVSSWFKDQAGQTAPSIVRKLHAAYLKDASDNQFDAVGHGSPIFIDGTIARQACVFDGVDDYFAIIEMNYNASSLGHPVTIEARVAVDSDDIVPNGNTSDRTIIVTFDRNEYWRFGIGANVSSANAFKPSFSITGSGVANDVAANTDVADGVFRTLSVRYDPATNGGQIKFFIDGASDSITDSVGTWFGSAIARYGLIGENSEANVFNERLAGRGPAFKGKMEFLRIWHVARTDDEVNSYHDTTSIDTTSGLQVNYDFEMMGDITDRVMRWPTLRRHWSDVRPQAAVINLANDDGELSPFFTRQQAGLTTFNTEFGFVSPDFNNNPEFLNGGKGWNKTGPTSFSNGQACFFGTTLGADDIFEEGRIIPQGTYLCTVKVTSSNGGALSYFRVNPTDGYQAIPGWGGLGIYSMVVSADGSEFARFRGSSNWEGCIEYFHAYTMHTVPDSGGETINPFIGRLGNVSHEDGVLRLSIDDKIAQLADKVMGSNDAPATFTDSTLPSDIAWAATTSYGGFSDIQSTSNPDIDYASFQEWASVFSSDSVFTNADFRGQKVTEVMRKIARYTQSAIYMEGGKMRFSRFTAVNTESTDINDSHVIAPSEVKVDMLDLVTKQTVRGAYSVDSNDWGIEASAIDSNSSVSYGIREDIEKDENIWYTTSVSALNLAQRFTLIGGNPYEQIFAETNLQPLPRQVGETINYSDNQLAISKGYRIMEMEFNMNDGTFNLGINASQTETPFVLDQSELDGTDKLL